MAMRLLILLAAALFGLAGALGYVVLREAFDVALVDSAAGRTLCLILFLVALRLGLAAAGRRAIDSDRPAGQSARAGIVSAVLLGGLSLIVGSLPAIAGVTADIGLLDAFGGLVRVALFASIVFGGLGFALGGVLPPLPRAWIRTLGDAAGAGGLLCLAALLGAAVGLSVGWFPVADAIGPSGLLRIAGLAALGGALVLLIADRPFPEGHAIAEDALPGQQIEGRGPAFALLGLGGALALAAGAWIRLLAPYFADSPLLPTSLAALLFLGAAVGAGFSALLAGRLRRADLVLFSTVSIVAVAIAASVPSLGTLPAKLAAAAKGSETSALLQVAALAFLPVVVLTGAALPLATRVRADWLGTSPAALAESIGALATGAAAGLLLGALPWISIEPGAALIAVAIGLSFAGTWIRARAQQAPRVLPSLVCALPGLVLLTVAPLRRDLADAAPDPVVISHLAHRRTSAAKLATPRDVALHASFLTGLATNVLEGSPEHRRVLLDAPDGARVVWNDGVEIARLPAHGSHYDTDRAGFALGALAHLSTPGLSHVWVLGTGGGGACEALAQDGVRVRLIESGASIADILAETRGLEPGDDPALAGVQRERTCARTLLEGVGGDGAASAGRQWILNQHAHAFHPSGRALWTEQALIAARDASGGAGRVGWRLALADLTTGELHIALDTFVRVFPKVRGFYIAGELLLLGSVGEFTFSADHIDAMTAEGTRLGQALAARFDGGFGGLLKHAVLDEVVIRALFSVPAEPWQDAPAAATRQSLREIALGRAPNAWRPFFEAAPAPRFDNWIPDMEARERYMADAVRAWEDAGRADLAGLFDQASAWGRTEVGRLARGRAALLRGDGDRARRYAEMVQEQHGHSPEASRLRLDALGALRASNVDRQLLIDEIAAETGRFPKDGRVHAAAGAALAGLGEFDAARAHFERALSEEMDVPAPQGTRRRARPPVDDRLPGGPRRERPPPRDAPGGGRTRTGDARPAVARPSARHACAPHRGSRGRPRRCVRAPGSPPRACRRRGPARWRSPSGLRPRRP